MEETQTTQPTMGTWDRLPTEQAERKPKVEFDINITKKVVFLSDEPKEYQSDTGAYYVFDVEESGEQKVIMTSAWSLLRGLKALTPLKGKVASITKRLVKGKQNYEVVEIDPLKK